MLQQPLLYQIIFAHFITIEGLEKITWYERSNFHYVHLNIASLHIHAHSFHRGIGITDWE